jgi:hypothetical protein
MKTAIAALLVTLLDHVGASTDAPDLCADVYLNPAGEPITDATGTPLARFCEWTGPTAPAWDRDVCCVVDDKGAFCSTTSTAGRCSLGMRMHCDYGEVFSDDVVVCYQPFPSAACETGSGDTIQSTEYLQEDLLCCQNGDCYEWQFEYMEDCLGDFSWCSAGYLKEDGTVDCYD